MPKTIGPGSEIESYCTKCKLDLDHRVIAMDGAKPHKVECLTCRGHHRYRKPKSAAAAAKKKTTRKKTTRKKKTAPETIKDLPADELRATWESAIAGTGTEDFTPYRIDLQLAEGQLLRHKKFGDGVVAELLEGGKANVIFEAGPKTLVFGR